MNWETVENDTYYKGRQLESKARCDADPEKWIEFAGLKTQKGSYTLGVHGYLNAGCLYESQGEKKQALEAYKKGLEAAIKARNRDLAVIMTYRMAQIHENMENWDAAIMSYENLGAFCEEQAAHFQAADAYEHAAEMMARAGRDVSGYIRPIELWERNIRHWETHGHDHDAVWSRNHIELYKQLFGITK